MPVFVKFLAGVLIFAGLPLVGWGVTDVRGFLGHPARLGYLVLVVLLQAGILLRWPEVGRRGGEGKSVVRRQRLAVALLQVLSLAVVILAPYGDRRNVLAFRDMALVRHVGLVLFALGFIGINWAEAALGRLFSFQVELQEGHRLVTGGPFRLVRHPRYAFILLYSLGLSLVFRSGAALLLTGALLAVLLWRISDEEALLRRAFGEWEGYARRTWRLVPWLY
jgi:protein-S-isoprenylcysteine O-methyltransferase Ste14